METYETAEPLAAQQRLEVTATGLYAADLIPGDQGTNGQMRVSVVDYSDGGGLPSPLPHTIVGLPGDAHVFGCN